MVAIALRSVDLTKKLKKIGEQGTPKIVCLVPSRLKCV